MKPAWIGLIALTGCGEPTTTATVSPYQVPCVGQWGVSTCVELADDGAAPRPIFSGLADFQPEWGVQKRIEYRDPGATEDLNGGCAPVANECHVVERVISERQMEAGTPFTLVFPGDGDLFSLRADGLRLNTNTVVECVPQICMDVAALSPTTASFVVSFEFTAVPERPIRAVSVNGL